MALSMTESMRMAKFVKELRAGLYSRHELYCFQKQAESDKSKYNDRRCDYIKAYLDSQPIPEYVEDKTPEYLTQTAKIYTEDTELSPSDLDLIVANKLQQLKQSATKREKEFNLTFMDVKRLLKRRTCHYTGLKFNTNNSDLLLTIDRVDNKLGYIKGNVVACCHAVNQAKAAILEREGTFFKDNPKLLSKMLSKLI